MAEHLVHLRIRDNLGDAPLDPKPQKAPVQTRGGFLSRQTSAEAGLFSFLAGAPTYAGEG